MTNARTPWFVALGVLAGIAITLAVVLPLTLGSHNESGGGAAGKSASTVPISPARKLLVEESDFPPVPGGIFSVTNGADSRTHDWKSGVTPANCQELLKFNDTAATETAAFTSDLASLEMSIHQGTNDLDLAQTLINACGVITISGPGTQLTGSTTGHGLVGVKKTPIRGASLYLSGTSNGQRVVLEQTIIFAKVREYFVIASYGTTSLGRPGSLETEHKKDADLVELLNKQIARINAS